MQKILFLFLFCCTYSVIAQEPNIEDIIKKVEQEDPFEHVDNLIKATIQNLHNQIYLKELLLEYLHLLDKHKKDKKNPELAFKTSRTAHQLQSLIRQNHLQSLFSSSFLKKLSSLTVLSKNNDIPLLSP